MRKLVAIVVILVSIAVCDTHVRAGDGPQVLLILREGSFFDIELMLTKEVGVMISMLEEAGFEVVVASASGRPVGGPITTLEPDLKLADVEVADYVGLIIPCMAVGTWTAAIAPEAVAIVKQAVAEGKPVAAQRGGVVIVAQAGVLAGRRYAFLLAGRDPRGDPRFADAIYSGTGVVQDGNIITSAVCSERAKRHGLPDGTAELTQALIAELAFLSVVEPGNKLATTWADIKLR